MTNPLPSGKVRFFGRSLGEDAAKEGAGREEFFIDHHHVFSPASMVLLARRAGMALVLLERLRDPSGKYTLRAFLQLEAQ